MCSRMNLSSLCCCSVSARRTLDNYGRAKRRLKLFSLEAVPGLSGCGEGADELFKVGDLEGFLDEPARAGVPGVGLSRAAAGDADDFDVRIALSQQRRAGQAIHARHF